MQIGKEYWGFRLPPPLSPSEPDVCLYRSLLLPGSTLLLGCTHDLIGLSDRQLDIDPWLVADTVVVGDWRDNRDFFTNIIGDGVMNFTKDLAASVLEMAGRSCSRLVVRSFSRRHHAMRVAAHFPAAADFAVPPSLTMNMGDYDFFVWDFS